MLVPMICIIFQICCALFTYSNAQGAENFYVEKLYWCPALPNPVIKIFVSFQNTSNNFQTIDANLSSNVNIGENQMLLGYIETKVLEKQRQWLKLFELKDEFCRALKMYVGEFGYDIQRAAGIIPGTCPMRKGNYHVSNIELNFRRLKLQAFPFGTLKITLKIRDKYTSAELACFVAIISNHPRNK